jgi:N-methylhydantoinase A/oxoprolinase/acetone carboxylase beta subunit
VPKSTASTRYSSRWSRRRARRAHDPSCQPRPRRFFDGRFVVTPIYDGTAMRAGHRVKGPAIIEEPFTTIVLHPQQEATLDRHGNYRIEL